MIENSKIIHELTAFKDISNISINDYYLRRIEIEEHSIVNSSFLGQDYFLLTISIGNFKKGETKTISYTLANEKTSALLGADTYFIEGEQHQLYPREVQLNISDNFLSRLLDYLQKKIQGG